MTIADNEGAEHLRGAVRDQALMIDGTPAPREAGGGGFFFLARRMSRGVGSCFRERAVLWRRRWGSPVPAGPTEVGGTCCLPKAPPDRQRGTGSGIREAGCGGASASGAFGNG